MPTVPIDKIIVQENRHRKTFAKAEIDSLATSIQSFGLMHPPVVKQDDSGGFVLMAGERRLRACKQIYAAGGTIRDIPPGEISYTLFEDVDALMAKEIELEENIRRVDLTWKETAAATAELHKLRLSQDPTWTQTKTAEEIKERGGSSVSQLTIRNRVLLAENLHRPNVASASSEAQAIKNLTRELENEFKAAMLGKLPPTTSPHILECIDAVEGIKILVAPGSVDVVITDPPYGIDAGEFGIQTVTQTHNYTDAWENVAPKLEETLIAATAACKPQAHLYLFCDFIHFEEIGEMLTNLGWFVWSRPLIWVKNSGYTPRADYGPRRNYECILFANRGMKMVTGVYSDVLIYPVVQNKVHAAEKPMEVYRDLLLRSTIPGNLVLDPFCGSGVVLQAASAMNLKAIAFDNDPTSVVNSRRHLA